MQHDLALAAGHGKIDHMRDIAFPVELCIGQLSADLLTEIVRQLLHMGVILVKVRHADLARLGKCRDIRHGLGTGTHAALLTAAEGQRRQAQALFDIQRADALGRTDFVSGNTHQIAAPLFRREPHAAETLHGVDVEQRLGCLRLEQLSELLDRLHRADLVVDQLAGQQDRVLGQRFAQHLGRDVAGRVGREEYHIKAAVRELLCGVDGRGVLDLGHDDAAFFMAVKVRRAVQADIRAFGAAGGEIELLGQAAERGGNRFAAVLEQM